MLIPLFGFLGAVWEHQIRELDDAGQPSEARYGAIPCSGDQHRELFDRLAGILLTAIAFTLLASGFTRLVTDVLHDLKVL